MPRLCTSLAQRTNRHADRSLIPSTSLGDHGKDFAYGVIIDSVGQAAKSGALTPSTGETPSPPSCQAGSKRSWEVARGPLHHGLLRGGCLYPGNNISTLVMPTPLKSFNGGHHQALHSLLLPFPFSSNVYTLIYTHTHTHTLSPFIMKVLQHFLALATGSLALTIPSTSDRKLLERDAEADLMPRASCENSASDRSCWGDYSIDTNYYVRGV